MAQKHAVTETVSNLKHEIFNPLTSILSRVQLLLEQEQIDSTEEMTKYLEIIETQTVRISEIVTNLDQTVETGGPFLQDPSQVLTHYGLKQ